MTLDIQLDKASQVMEQAWMTAHDYLLHGVFSIDKQLGEGYAAKHPELLAAFMRTCAQDYHTGLMKAALQDIRDRLPLHGLITELIQSKLGQLKD